MTWFKIDDTLATHPKARRAGLAAMGLWAVCGAYASQHLTEGYVPDWFVKTWPQGVTLARKLVDAGLWTSAEDGCGWNFHQWDERNPSKEEVEEKRAFDRDRQAKWRADQKEKKRLLSQRDNTNGHSVTNGVTTTVSHTTRNGPPVPSRPDPTQLGKDKTSSNAAALDAEFDRFWQVYPRKVGKGQARIAFRAARRKAGVEQIATALHAYIRAAETLPKDRVRHPSTWLNGEPWCDDPEAIAPIPVVRADPRQQHTDHVFDNAAEWAASIDRTQQKAIS